MENERDKKEMGKKEGTIHPLKVGELARKEAGSYDVCNSRLSAHQKGRLYLLSPRALLVSVIVKGSRRHVTP